MSNVKTGYVLHNFIVKYIVALYWLVDEGKWEKFFSKHVKVTTEENIYIQTYFYQTKQNQSNIWDQGFTTQELISKANDMNNQIWEGKKMHAKSLYQERKCNCSWFKIELIL